ncbi:MAG: hypothetical protein WAR79_05525 [Melioribacteraceae bacterium]
MKNLIILLTVALLTFVGCQDDNSILEPNLNSEFSSLNKKTEDVNIDLPIEKVKAKYSKNYTIDGAKGGNIFVEYKWKDKSNNNKKSVVRADLEIPAGAFSGELTFEMIFDLENYTLELYPSPFTFNKPVILDLTFQNIVIEDGDGDFIFNYLDGPFEDINYGSVEIDEKTGTMIVKGAELHHFSRYGWTRTK